MNCLRCGRNVPKGVLFCDLCREAREPATSKGKSSRRSGSGDEAPASRPAKGKKSSPAAADPSLSGSAQPQPAQSMSAQSPSADLQPEKAAPPEPTWEASGEAAPRQKRPRLFSSSGGLFASRAGKKAPKQEEVSTKQEEISQKREEAAPKREESAPKQDKPAPKSPSPSEPNAADSSSPAGASASRRRLVPVLMAVVIVLLAAGLTVMSLLFFRGRTELAEAQLQAQRLPEVEAQRDSLSAELEQTNSKYTEAQTTISQLNQTNAGLRDDVQRLESEKASAIADLTAELGELTGQIEELTAQNETAAAELEELQTQLEAAEDEKKSLSAKVDDLSGEIDDLEDELDTCYTKINTLNRTITQYETRNTFFNRYVGFVCPGDSRYYHRYGCSKLSLTGAWRVIRIDTNSYYSACPDCR